MADRDKQFIGSMSPQDLGEPDAGIADADRDATGWDLRSMEDVQQPKGRKRRTQPGDEGLPEDLGEDVDDDPTLTIYGSGGRGTRLPDDLMSGLDDESSEERG